MFFFFLKRIITTIIYQRRINPRFTEKSKRAKIQDQISRSKNPHPLFTNFFSLNIISCVLTSSTAVHNVLNRKKNVHSKPFFVPIFSLSIENERNKIHTLN